MTTFGAAVAAAYFATLILALIELVKWWFTETFGK